MEGNHRKEPKTCRFRVAQVVLECFDVVSGLDWALGLRALRKPKAGQGLWGLELRVCSGIAKTFLPHQDLHLQSHLCLPKPPTGNRKPSKY